MLLSASTHESNHSLQTFPDDGPGVFHLGRVVSPDLRLPAQPRLHPERADLDSQLLPGRRHRRHVLQQPVRGPEFRRGEVPLGQSSHRRHRHAVAGLDQVVLAVLRRDARALPALRPDDLDHEFHRVRADEGRAEGIRHRAHGRHDRLDPRGVADDVHPRGLGQGACGADDGIRELDRNGPRLRPDRAGAAGRHQRDVRRRRRRIAAARGLQPDAPPHAAETGDQRRGQVRLARSR